MFMDLFQTDPASEIDRQWYQICNFCEFKSSTVVNTFWKRNKLTKASVPDLATLYMTT